MDVLYAYLTGKIWLFLEGTSFARRRVEILAKVFWGAEKREGAFPLGDR